MKILGIEITHPDKIMFPDLKFTKGDMVQYYGKIAPHMLPYLLERPLTLQRFPGGITKGGFYQKHAQDYYPDFIDRITVETEDGKAEEIMCNNEETLVYLANQGTVSFHPWLSRQNDLHRPDKVVFDLDPSDGVPFAKIKKAAKLVGELLRTKGIDPNLMTTGKSGIHVYYGIKPTLDFDKVREDTRDLAEQLVSGHPELFTLEIRKNKRGDKIFLDYLRNAYAQTSVCPFSLRPTQQAGVATPLRWKDLDTIKSAHHYSVKNIFRRLGAKSD